MTSIKNKDSISRRERKSRGKKEFLIIFPFCHASSKIFLFYMKIKIREILLFFSFLLFHFFSLYFAWQTKQKNSKFLLSFFYFFLSFFFSITLYFPWSSQSQRKGKENYCQWIQMPPPLHSQKHSIWLPLIIQWITWQLLFGQRLAYSPCHHLHLQKNTSKTRKNSI